MMCSIWLEVGEDRIPVTRKELKSLAVCVRNQPGLSGLAADILDSLGYLDAPIPTDDTLARLVAIASAVRRTPVPEGPCDGIGDAVIGIGVELAETAESWFGDTCYNYAIVIRSRKQLMHWANLLRGHGNDQYADNIDGLVNRIKLILPELL